MNWTRKAPTVAGWYWWRRDQHALPGVAIACSDLSGYYMNRTGHNSTFDHVDDVIGEWLGPISPTDRQQGRVEGLRDSMDDLRKRMDRDDGDTDNDVWKHLAWCELQIKAQAAQDEKPTKEGL